MAGQTARRSFLLAVGLSLFLVLGYGAYRWVVHDPSHAHTQSAMASRAQGSGHDTLDGGALLLSDFTLIDRNGSPRTAQSFIGRPSLWFFGYTECPDICLPVLNDMTLWLETLGTQRSLLDARFVSIDPKRDGPSQITAFLEPFSPPVEGFAITENEREKLSKAFFLHIDVLDADPMHDQNDGHNHTEPQTPYLVDHTSSVFMVTSQGRLFGTISTSETREVIMQKLRRLIDHDRAE